MILTTTILIILGSNGQGAVATQEFRNLEACLYAKQQVEEFVGKTNNRYGAICVPKFKD